MPLTYQKFKDRRSLENFLYPFIISVFIVFAYANDPPSHLGEWFLLLAFGVILATPVKFLADYLRPNSKYAYEKYLKSHYLEDEKNRKILNKSIQVTRDEKLEEKEAALIAELYALKAEQGSVTKSSEQYIAELETELDQEQRISRLEADLATERGMREKYKEMALRGVNQ